MLSEEIRAKFALVFLCFFSMASRFFHVQHEFRAGKSQQWWDAAQKAMAPGGGWDEAVSRNLQAGFFNHSFNPIAPEGPAFCFWEVQEGITEEPVSYTHLRAHETGRIVVFRLVGVKI